MRWIVNPGRNGQTLTGTFNFLQATCADAACSGALQHPRVPPHDGAGQHRSRVGRLRAVDTGLRAVPQQLQRRSSREDCCAGIVCFVAGRPNASSLRSVFRFEAAPPFTNGHSRANRLQHDSVCLADLSVQTGAGERIGDLPRARKSLESQLQRSLARQAGGASRTGSRGNPHSSGA